MKLRDAINYGRRLWHYDPLVWRLKISVTWAFSLTMLLKFINEGPF